MGGRGGSSGRSGGAATRSERIRQIGAAAEDYLNHGLMVGETGAHVSSVRENGDNTIVEYTTYINITYPETDSDGYTRMVSEKETEYHTRTFSTQELLNRAKQRNL